MSYLLIRTWRVDHAKNASCPPLIWTTLIHDFHPEFSRGIEPKLPSVGLNLKSPPYLTSISGSTFPTVFLKIFLSKLLSQEFLSQGLVVGNPTSDNFLEGFLQLLLLVGSRQSPAIQLGQFKTY